MASPARAQAPKTRQTEQAQGQPLVQPWVPTRNTARASPRASKEVKPTRPGTPCPRTVCFTEGPSTKAWAWTGLLRWCVSVGLFYSCEVATSSVKPQQIENTFPGPRMPTTQSEVLPPVSREGVPPENRAVIVFELTDIPRGNCKPSEWLPPAALKWLAAVTTVTPKEVIIPTQAGEQLWEQHKMFGTGFFLRFF